MTDTNTPPAGGNGEMGGEQVGSRISVLGQYIKDLSFENPRAPQSMQGPGENPNLSVNVSVNGHRIGEDIYESSIHLNVSAENDAGVLYHLELAYAGAFQMQNIPEGTLQPVLLINCPALLFPFARRLVADLTREGGFPPLMLDPIDFAALYRQNTQKQAQPAESGSV